VGEGTFEYGERQRSKGIPPIGVMMSSSSSIAIERYNEETIILLKQSVTKESIID